ncbi:hypothetical protein B0H65DRAFT_552586 [Neurospora tetraspora]|uniref:Uncharacterized protein n=1 Tax=Neurospora tetraspora TaxID=94610 RepID=A0AAE0J729_9PEZI|nr:hypothetical protein B0H65DRAFT_552586 [Neurospora tetraspora]
MSVLSDFYPSDDEIDWLSDEISESRASDLAPVGASGLSEAKERMREAEELKSSVASLPHQQDIYNATTTSQYSRRSIGTRVS